MAFGALVVLVVGSLALVALDVAASPLGRRTVVAGLTVLVLMPAVMLGQYAPPPYRLPYRWRWGLLLVQAVLTYIPLLLFHYRWLSLLGFLAGAVLLTLPPNTSVPLALAVGASGPLLATTGLIDTDRNPLNVLLGTAITASTVFAVAHLALLTARLHGSREHAAHLAEQRERARMQQDLHDLVGSSLTAIVLQGEAALRDSDTPAGGSAEVAARPAGGAEPARAAEPTGSAEPAAPAESAEPAGSEGPAGSVRPGQERDALREIIGLARRLHDDVRSISRPDGCGLSLADELAHAQRVLTASGVEVRTVLPPRVEPDPAAVGCLRFVLREAVGNVLQHSRATHCAITLRAEGTAIRLTVRNDGAEEGTGMGAKAEAEPPAPASGRQPPAPASGRQPPAPASWRQPPALPSGRQPTAPASGRQGTGLAGLSSRVLALGGEFTAGAEGGTFTLTATVPSSPGALAPRP
ncbi:sensor histidine kinase [Streptomyces sp. cmx-18-6]|uniref:sensor histidine kinase n=1 Tax=Streptomyces sp. cmx-18-6 TaxID=2790930 RepID=UPI00397FA628